MVETPIPKPLVIGDSATTAHLRVALNRAPRTKPDAAMMKAKSEVSPPKAPTDKR